MDSKTFRRHLRKESTPAENTLWFLLRNRKFLNLKFRRQHTIGKFTVDFYNEHLKLIIEADGGVHDNLGQANYDDERSKFLESLGYRIYRVDNDAILNNMEVVKEDLEAFVKDILSLG